MITVALRQKNEIFGSNIYANCIKAIRDTYILLILGEITNSGHEN